MTNFNLYSYCLFNEETKILLNGLTVEQVSVFAHSVRDIDNDWYVWELSWDQWKSLSSCVEFMEWPMPEHLEPPEFSLEDSVVPELNVAKMSSYIDEKNNLNKAKAGPSYGYQSSITNVGEIPDLTVEEERSVADFMNRAHERLILAYDVEIEVDKQIFRTQTVDVSIGGIRVKDPLPDWVVGYCLLRIIKTDKQEEVELMFSVVENQSPSEKYRIEFSQMSDKKKELKLGKWLAAA
ncbi:MAG: PilZ domain-containing protein [Bdellovibrionaceae bacterium]|jgi:hypothetical protein|nr:PilZ domain-containing protein [Pseudobdellovibrionaceae bacterium]